MHAIFGSALQIFGIYMIKDKDNVTLEDVLQPGTNMLAAGYCMYGSSCTVIIYVRSILPPDNSLRLVFLY